MNKRRRRKTEPILEPGETPIGKRSTVGQRRLRKGCGLVTGRFEASSGWEGRAIVSSSSSDSESEMSESESEMKDEKGLGVENRDSM